MSLLARIKTNDDSYNVCPMTLGLKHGMEVKVNDLNCKEGSCAIYDKEAKKCAILSLAHAFQGVVEGLEKIEKPVRKPAKAAKGEVSQ